MNELELKKIMVNRVRNLGEHLIKNAEDIVGDPSNVSSIYISAELFELAGIPKFDVSKQYCVSKDPRDELKKAIKTRSVNIDPNFGASLSVSTDEAFENVRSFSKNVKEQ